MVPKINDVMTELPNDWRMRINNCTFAVNWSLEDFEVEFASLATTIEQNELQRKADEAEAILRFEDRVTNLMHTGTNRQRIIAWLMDAENANGDFEYFCYTQGLPYGYFKDLV